MPPAANYALERQLNKGPAIQNQPQESQCKRTPVTWTSSEQLTLCLQLAPHSGLKLSLGQAARGGVALTLRSH